MKTGIGGSTISPKGAVSGRKTGENDATEERAEAPAAGVIPGGVGADHRHASSSGAAGEVHRDLNLAQWTKSLPRQACGQRPIAPISAPAADTYPMPLPTSPAADKTHPASTRRLHIQQPASPPPPDSAASVPLPVRS